MPRRAAPAPRGLLPIKPFAAPPQHRCVPRPTPWPRRRQRESLQPMRQRSRQRFGACNRQNGGPARRVNRVACDGSRSRATSVSAAVTARPTRLRWRDARFTVRIIQRHGGHVRSKPGKGPEPRLPHGDIIGRCLGQADESLGWREAAQGGGKTKPRKDQQGGPGGRCHRGDRGCGRRDVTDIPLGVPTSNGPTRQPSGINASFRSSDSPAGERGAPSRYPDRSSRTRRPGTAIPFAKASATASTCPRRTHRSSGSPDHPARRRRHEAADDDDAPARPEDSCPSPRQAAPVSAARRSVRQRIIPRQPDRRTKPAPPG